MKWSCYCRWLTTMLLDVNVFVLPVRMKVLAMLIWRRAKLLYNLHLSHSIQMFVLAFASEKLLLFFLRNIKIWKSSNVRSIFVHKLCNAHKSRHHKEIKKFSTPKLVHSVYLALSIVDMFLISRQIECTLCCSEKLVTGLELYCKKRCSTLN